MSIILWNLRKVLNIFWWSSIFHNPRHIFRWCWSWAGEAELLLRRLKIPPEGNPEVGKCSVGWINSFMLQIISIPKTLEKQTRTLRFIIIFGIEIVSYNNRFARDCPKNGYLNYWRNRIHTAESEDQFWWKKQSHYDMQISFAARVKRYRSVIRNVQQCMNS